jgi:ubiquinone biosynthesis UbiH/UbiF/VisC/COQ6 family hydroxylase
MGYIVEHQHLVHVLATVVTRLPSVARAHATFGALAAAAPARLCLSTGVTIEARLVLGADGANSAVREAAGIAVRRKPYGERAVICNVEFSTAHANVARQRFLASGPIASLPLHEPHAASIVWTLPAHSADEILHADTRVFAGAVTTACAATPGAVTRVGPRAAYTLERLTAARMVADRCVLLGDAAHVVHPLAGQGLNLGLMDVAALYECLDAGAAVRGADPSREALRRFERWRKSETAAMSLTIAALHALFARDERPLRALRGVGLDLTSRARPLARWLAAQAMGAAGDVPRLARLSYSD